MHHVQPLRTQHHALHRRVGGLPADQRAQPAHRHVQADHAHGRGTGIARVAPDRAVVGHEHLLAGGGIAVGLRPPAATLARACAATRADRGSRSRASASAGCRNRRLRGARTSCRRRRWRRARRVRGSASPRRCRHRRRRWRAAGHRACAARGRRRARPRPGWPHRLRPIPGWRAGRARSARRGCGFRVRSARSATVPSAPARSMWPPAARPRSRRRSTTPGACAGCDTRARHDRTQATRQ